MDFVLIPTHVLDSKEYRALKRTDRRACLDAYVQIVDNYVLSDPSFQLQYSESVYYRAEPPSGLMTRKIEASKTAIAKEIDVDARSFRDKIWPTLIELGLVFDAAPGEVHVYFYL